jgi:hypothetical protein
MTSQRQSARPSRQQHGSSVGLAWVTLSRAPKLGPLREAVAWMASTKKGVGS